VWTTGTCLFTSYLFYDNNQTDINQFKAPVCLAVVSKLWSALHMEFFTIACYTREMSCNCVHILI
jgi:hypothetical protein